MKAFLAIVKGSVQGVGFRFNTMRKANELSIGGWVKNLSNNTVEVFAESDDEKKLEEFLEFLNKGPFGSRVTEVNFQEKTPKGLVSFEIKH
jgi:acylphosphatase